MKAGSDATWLDRVRNSIRLLLRQRNAVVGGVIIAIFLFLALTAGVISPHSPYQTNARNRLAPPSSEHWFGTDSLGRDILSRVIYGSRISLQVGVIAVSFAVVVGVTAGLVAGTMGGGIDSLIMRLVDVLLSFPGLLLALVMIAILGPGLTNAMIAIGIGSSPVFARVTRGQVLSIIELEYVESARALGARGFRVVTRHILPNVLSPIIVLATMRVATAIMTEASLSFLGLGASPPAASWGGMISEGRRHLLDYPWVPIIPGVMVLVTVLGFNLFGDGLRDALDPRIRKI